MDQNYQPTLYLSTCSLLFDDLKKGFFPSALSEYEKQTVRFCHDWLNGQETFTVATSGSTGTPKPILLTRRQMALSARMTAKALGLQSGDRALVNLSTQYIAGIMMLVRGLELGLSLTIIPPSSLPLSEFPETAHFDFLSFVPMQLQATLQQTPQKISILNWAKAILLGGAPVSEALTEQIQVIQAPVFHTYGMTETVSHIALKLLNGPGKQKYFTVLEGVEIHADESGCLVIRTPVLNDQEVITNDVVKLISNHSFEWFGRIDNVINSGGVKVQAEKVEAVVGRIFETLKLTQRYFIAALPHPELGEAVTLFIEGAPLTPTIEQHLWEGLRSSELPRYEVPKSISYKPVFLETPTGKIDKRRIVEG